MTVERASAGRRVLVIGQLDGAVNSVKPLEIERFLRERGHQVRVVDTYHLSRAFGSTGAVAGRLPGASPGRLALYATELLSSLLLRHPRPVRRRLSFYFLMADHRLRRAVLRATLPLDEYDLIICETPYDAGVLADARHADTLYDGPAPWADEVYYEGRLTERQHSRMRRLEAAVLEGTHHLSFHWESYARYTVERYPISGRNLMTLNFGCTPSPRRARFAPHPRIVYLGNATSHFQNPELLARLARLHQPIDMYGSRPPDPGSGLTHRGFAPSLDVLADYQLGLVTCSDDPLRQQGFSSKHLNYLAYGLPALVPQWRRGLGMLDGSVGYTEETFRAVLDALGDEHRWQQLSDRAYDQACRLSWDRTLQPLADLLAKTPARATPGGGKR